MTYTHMIQRKNFLIICNDYIYTFLINTPFWGREYIKIVTKLPDESSYRLYINIVIKIHKK